MAAAVLVVDLLLAEQVVAVFEVDSFRVELAAVAVLLVGAWFVEIVVVEMGEVEGVDVVVSEAEAARRRLMMIWMLRWMSTWAAIQSNQNMRSLMLRWILIGMVTVEMLELVTVQLPIDLHLQPKFTGFQCKKSGCILKGSDLD